MKNMIIPLTVFISLSLFCTGALAVSVSVTQSGADADEVMKGRTFTVEASG